MALPVLLRRPAVVIVAAAVLALADSPRAEAVWPASLAGGSHGSAASGLGPAVPTSVTAHCTSLLLSSVTINWTAVPHASSYTVFQSTTGVAGSFPPVGTTSATSFVS